MSDASDTITISTSLGGVRGLRRGRTGVFKGIRYATASRFAVPVIVDEWPDAELDATRYAAQCPQHVGMIEQALGASSLPMREDCLFLNVFAPLGEIERAARPVLVWIHGGAFTNGSGAMPWYDGTSLVERGDVVVVTINYRLGALGFAGPANLGVRDQVVALQWVQQHIAAFGGDPGDVTIFGESAGGASVITLFATPSAAGLFHRGMAMSPSITQLRSRRRAEQALAELLRGAQVADLTDLVDEPVDRLLDVQGEMLRDVGAGFTGFSPCADGELIPTTIVDAAAANPLPLVIGTTRDEMSLFTTFNPALADLTDDGLLAFFAKRFGEGADVAIHEYRRARPGAAAKQVLSAMQTDDVFRVPARRLAEARLAVAAPTWMYWFTWASPAFGGALGSCHAVDIPFAFHNLDRPGVTQFTGDDPGRVAVADAYSAAVVALAHAGSPGWEPYDATSRTTRCIDVVSEDIDDPERALRELWAAV